MKWDGSNSSNSDNSFNSNNSVISCKSSSTTILRNLRLSNKNRRDNEDDAMNDDEKAIDKEDGRWCGLVGFRRSGVAIIEFKKDVEIRLPGKGSFGRSQNTTDTDAEYQLVIELLSAILIAPKERPIVAFMTNLSNNNEEARIAYIIEGDVVQVTRTVNSEVYEAMQFAFDDKIKDYYKDIKIHSQQGTCEIVKMNRWVFIVFFFFFFFFFPAIICVNYKNNTIQHK